MICARTSEDSSKHEIMPLTIVQKIAVHTIRLYQRTLSPDTGWFSYRYPYGACRFTPTCSTYTLQAIERRGVLLGTLLGMRRVLRCHPWQAGGFDPVIKS